MKAHSHPSVGCRALAGLQAEANCSHLPELPEQPHHHQMQPTPVSHYIHPSRGDSQDGFPCLTPMLGGALLEYLPAGQGHRVNAKSRLSNSPQPPTRLSRERSRWKTRDRKYFLNFSMGSSLQNVSKRRVKGGGIHPPEVCCCPGGAIIFSWGPLKNSRCRERLSQREAFSELPLLAKWN